MNNGKPKPSKRRNLNVKLLDEDYVELQKIAKDIGLSLSSMMRMVISLKLKKVKKSGDSNSFLLN